MGRIADAYLAANGRYPDAPGFKEAGGTSEAAARSMGNVGPLQALVVKSIQFRGSVGATADEVAADIGQTIMAVRPRCTELFRLGLIRKSLMRRANASGRMASVWVCVEK